MNISIFSPATKLNAFLSIAILSLFVEGPRERKSSMAEVKETDSIVLGFRFDSNQKLRWCALEIIKLVCMLTMNGILWSRSCAAL